MLDQLNGRRNRMVSGGKRGKSWSWMLNLFLRKIVLLLFITVSRIVWTEFQIVEFVTNHDELDNVGMPMFYTAFGLDQFYWKFTCISKDGFT